MKFRVETLAPGEPWHLVKELSNESVARMMFEAWREQCPPTEMVRLSHKSTIFGWILDSQASGTKETKPMSTKQRGDVEKITPQTTETFRIIKDRDGNAEPFTRDELRRIWEAGNVEFAQPITSGMAAVYSERLAEKDREIARLKADIVQMSKRDIEEIHRLRAWLEEIDKIVNLRGEVERSVARALAGEKVSE